MSLLLLLAAAVLASAPPPEAGAGQAEAAQKRDEDPHAGHDHAHAGHDHAHADHDMQSVTGGPFRSMNAIGSGTALQPASTPMEAWHFRPGSWTVMVHGELKAGFNFQGGRRGIGKLQSQNWGMAMAERSLGAGRLMLRGMLSAEPLTAPHGGFPHLFQTGETYRGRAIIDAQHPHDAVMELAGGYTLPLSDLLSLQFYGGPVAEPALGPVAFMHRASAIENPSSPLGHHWQDSTHVSHGVLTFGVTAWRFRGEYSRFHGKEPDEDRLRIDLGALDSSSYRLWFAPGRNWALQFSRGHLASPELLHPGDLDRRTASIGYNRTLQGGNWASTLAWGRNREVHGTSNAYLVESTLRFLRHNSVYTRLELVDKQGLFDDNIFDRLGMVCARIKVSNRVAASTSQGTLVCNPGGPLPTTTLSGIVLHGGSPPMPGRVYPTEIFNRWMRVGAFTFGGVRDLASDGRFRIGLGADVTFRSHAEDLDAIYGNRPSFQIFLRLRGSGGT